MKPLAHLLESIPAARLFDEILKLFLAGKSLQTFELMCKYDVFQYLFPVTAEVLQENNFSDNELLRRAFASTDLRIREMKSVTPAFLLAAILWPAIKKHYNRNLENRKPPMIAMHQAAQSIISAQVKRISIPKRFSIPMREIWEFQLRLPKRKRANALMNHKRFRAAYDFILLREGAGEDLMNLGQWWTEYQAAEKSQREQMLASLSTGHHHSKSSKRGVKSTRGNR